MGEVWNQGVRVEVVKGTVPHHVLWNLEAGHRLASEKQIIIHMAI